MATTQPRRFGFPWLMLLGYCLGAAAAVGAAFALTPAWQTPANRFGGAFFQLTLCLGGLGTYAGHIVGAATNRVAGHRPFGPLTPWVIATGFVIWLAGSAAVLTTVAVLCAPPRP